MPVVSTLNVLGDLPSRASVGYLDPEIANEGLKIAWDHTEAKVEGIPPEKLAYPDYSTVKHLRKYFNRTGYQVFPTWVYHPIEPARIVKNAKEAAEFKIEFRATTGEERAAFGVNYRWDNKGEWRTTPYPAGKRVVDPDNVESGKNYIPRASVQVDRESDVARTVAAVLAALKSVDKPSAPGGVDPKQWQEFQEFLAFRESQKTVDAVEPVPEDEDEPQVVSMHGEADQRDHWLAEAERLGIKVDRRWGIDRLREECEKAS